MMLRPSILSLVVCASVVGPPQQVPVFRSGVDLVNLGVTVFDKKGALVTDLAADDFAIVENGTKQTVQYFASGDPADPVQGGPPMHLGLVLDTSESMGEDMKFTQTAAVKFLNTLLDAVDITVVDFDTEVRVARYGQHDFARLIERIRQRKATGWTALYDAIGVYLEGAAGLDGRKIVLLYTDGGDTRTSTPFHELLDLLKASDATVYAIGELEHQSSSGAAEARRTLQQIAETTGGQAFFPMSVKEIDEIYGKVLAQIRAQYTIGYLSTNEKTDGAWRKVEIRVTRKDGREYRVRARRGYYASSKKPG